MKEQFKVVKIDNKVMTLEANRASHCNHCSANSSCGTGILTHYFKHYAQFNRVLQQGVEVGDLVTLEISTRELLFKAFLLYTLPILVLFFTSYLAMVFSPSQEWWHIIFGFAGFIGTLLFLKYWLK